MSPRTPWLLAAVCAGLGVFLWLLETQRQTPAKAARTALLPLAARQIERIELKWASANAHLRRDDGGWWLAPPGGTRQRADRGAVNAALAELELLSRGGRVREGTPSSAHGLAPPRLRVTIAGGGREASVSFGARAGPRRVYAAVDGQLYLVDRRALSLWGTGPDRLVDRRLIHFDPETTRRIELLSTSLERRGTRWYLGRPAGARANPERVRKLLQTLGSVRTTPRGKGAAIRVDLVDEKGRRRGKGRVSPEARGKLRKILTRLPDRRPVRIPSAWIRTLEIRAGDKKLRLSRDKDGWRLPDGAAAQDGAVSGLLGGLNRLEAREILGPEAARLAEPIRRVIAWESQAGRGELRVGPARSKRRAARFASEAAVYVFGEGAWARASTDPLDWRRLTVWDLPPASIEAIRLGDAEIRRDRNFRWQRVRPAGTAPTAADAEALAKALARPQVRRFLRKPLPRTIATLRVETIDGTRRTWHDLEVGPAAPAGGRYARAGGRTSILDERVWRQVLRVLRPRGLVRGGR